MPTYIEKWAFQLSAKEMAFDIGCSQKHRILEVTRCGNVFVCVEIDNPATANWDERVFLPDTFTN